MDAAGKVREGREAEKRLPPYDASEPWRGEAQEGNGLVPGVTTGRGERALCRDEGPEGEPVAVRRSGTPGPAEIVREPGGTGPARGCPC